MLGYTEQLFSKNKREVNNLRLKTFKQTKNLTVNPQALYWNESDEKGIVLGIRDSNEKLISTMRIETLHNWKEVKEKLDYDFAYEHIHLPAGLLGKAVTDPSHQGLGLNTYLRYLAYPVLHQKGLQYVIGTVQPHAPRLSLLQKLGYTFVENKSGWSRFGYQSGGTTLVCILDLRKNFKNIMNTLKPLVQKNIRLYPERLLTHDISKLSCI